MPLMLVGINYQTAPLVIRERFACSKEDLPKILTGFSCTEVVLISTCNRTEVVAQAKNSSELTEAISRIFQLNTQSLKDNWYVYYEASVMKHLVRVAAGLDSMILGEPQIFGQVKEAYEIAQEAGTVGKALHQTFQRVFALSKKIRSETAIGKNPISVAFAAVALSKHVFADLADCRVLVVGAGETAALATRHFAEQQVKGFYFVNRTLKDAIEFSHIYQGEAFELAELTTLLPMVDIILTATASPIPLLSFENLQQGVKKRTKPLLLLDLAVPRNISPEVAQLQDCYLYTIDDLQAIAQQGLEQRQEAAQVAEEIIEQEVEKFYQAQKTALDGEAIGRFSQYVDTMIEAYTAEAVHSNTVEDAIILAKRLAKKIQHEALLFLKQIGKD